MIPGFHSGKYEDDKSSETPSTSTKQLRRNIPEDSHLQKVNYHVTVNKLK
jgi:hypothetical protein